jgi:hypothetical protein
VKKCDSCPCFRTLVASRRARFERAPAGICGGLPTKPRIAQRKPTDAKHPPAMSGILGACLSAAMANGAQRS